MGIVYFVDGLVDVDRVECFGHVESGENCSMRSFFFVETSEYGVIDLM